MVVLGNGRYALFLRYEEDLAVVKYDDGEIDRLPKDELVEVSFEELYEALLDIRNNLQQVKQEYEDIIEELPQIRTYQHQIESLTKENTQVERDLRAIWELDPSDELPEGLRRNSKPELIIYDQQETLQYLAKYNPDILTINKTKLIALYKESSPQERTKMGVALDYVPQLTISKDI